MYHTKLSDVIQQIVSEATDQFEQLTFKETDMSIKQKRTVVIV